MDLSEKKQEILEAAKKCFSRYGYEKATLDDIGKIVGLNKASLYYYYKSKEAIFTELIVKEGCNFIKYISAELEHIESCRDQIITYFNKRFKYFRDAMVLNQLSIETTKKLQGLFQKLTIDFRSSEIEILGTILKRGIEKRQISPCDTEKTAGLLLILTEGIKHNLISAENCLIPEQIDLVNLEQEITTGIDLVFNGLK